MYVYIDLQIIIRYHKLRLCNFSNSNAYNLVFCNLEFPCASTADSYLVVYDSQCLTRDALLQKGTPQTYRQLVTYKMCKGDACMQQENPG